MSIEQCERAYLKLSESIFTPKRTSLNLVGRASDFLNANGKFDAKILEAVIKEVIVEEGKLAEGTLLQEIESQCKV